MNVTCRKCREPMEITGASVDIDYDCNITYICKKCGISVDVILEGMTKKILMIGAKRL